MGLFRKDSKPDLVDLREEPPKPVPLEFGLPTPCPQCGSPGYLDGIDIKRRLMFQHCTSCFAKWETSEADLAAR
jgi:hypothetical protein